MPAPAAPWWKAATVYQIYCRSFADSDGDGVGDLEGIRRRLDYIAGLGVDAIWLCPVFASPQVDNGYDVSDYQAVDPRFGTMDDLDHVVAAAHDRQIRIVLDLPVNHTSDRHPWFVESRSGPTAARRGWYWWRPPVGGGPPNNWQSFFSGDAWSLDPASGEYYLHLFAAGQPDLNWENPEVREAVYTMMRWWVGRGIDGFRMDVVNLLSKDPDLPDGDPTGHPVGHEWYMNGPRIHEFLREMSDSVFGAAGPRPVLIGETPGVTIPEARLYTDPRRRELDMIFHFELMAVDRGADKWDIRPLHLPAIKATLTRWQDGLADVGWTGLYWDNHDQPRAVSRFGHDGPLRVRSAKLLATVLHLQRGTPFVYQGEELGMTNAPLARLADVDDIEAIGYRDAALAAGVAPETVLRNLRAASRDNARTPMPWDGTAHAGFTTGPPWLPVNPNYVEINAADQLADPDSVYHYYRALIALRHHEPVIAFGDFQLLAPDDEQLYAFLRTYGSTALLVVANMSDRPADADGDGIRAWARRRVLLSNCPAPEGPDALTLAPWEARVYLHRA